MQDQKPENIFVMEHGFKIIFSKTTTTHCSHIYLNIEKYRINKKYVGAWVDGFVKGGAGSGAPAPGTPLQHWYTQKKSNLRILDWVLTCCGVADPDPAGFRSFAPFYLKKKWPAPYLKKSRLNYRGCRRGPLPGTPWALLLMNIMNRILDVY